MDVLSAWVTWWWGGLRLELLSVSFPPVLPSFGVRNCPNHTRQAAHTAGRADGCCWWRFRWHSAYCQCSIYPLLHVRNMFPDKRPAHHSSVPIFVFLPLHLHKYPAPQFPLCVKYSTLEKCSISASPFPFIIYSNMFDSRVWLHIEKHLISV